MANNLVGDAISARNAGYDELQGFTEGLAQKRAGRNMASGNLQGAAADLYGAGMLDAGLGVERVGQQRQDRAAAQEAGMADQEKARQAESLKFMAQAAGVLQKIPEDQRSQAYIEKIAPALKAMGAPDDVISQAGQHLDDQSLQLFSGQVEEALKGVVMAPGSQLRDPKTGALLAEAPFAPSFQKVGEGETLLQVGGATPSGASGGGGARNQRNNNPGNIEDGPFAQSLPGYQGSDGRFAIFADAGSGRAAQGRLLQSYGQRGFDTVEKIINRWAPPSDNNPTGAYVNFVAKRLGVPAGQQLDMTNPQVVQALAGAIEEFEGGGQSASNQGGGARVLAQGAPKKGREVENASPEEIISAGYAPGTRAQIDRNTGELKNIKQPTESQTKAAAFTRRVLDANDRLNALATKGTFKPSPQLLISEKNGVTRLVASNPTDRQFVQAAKEWLAPILRKDTGAAVTDSEMIVYMDMYIPRPEDDVGTLRQKANARQSAMIALAQESGGVFDATYGNRKFKSFMPSESRKREESSNTFDTDAGQVTVRPR